MFSARIMQKQQSLPGFLQKTCKNHYIYTVFCNRDAKTAIFTWFSATSVQKHQYLQGFLQRTCKNSNIYKVFCKRRAKTSIFTRFSATRMQKHQYLQGEWPCPSLCSLPKFQFWEDVISLHKFFTKSVISASKCPQLKNLDFHTNQKGLTNHDCKMLWLLSFFTELEILESVAFLCKFFTKSVICGMNCPK